jgi:hypothetical protein
MYRYQVTVQVAYGHKAEFLAGLRGIQALEAERGWARARVWSKLFGLRSVVVLEAEYPSLEAFEAEEVLRSGDPDYATRWSRIDGLGVQGGTTVELLSLEQGH